jgi:LacI family transcriptional regulator
VKKEAMVTSRDIARAAGVSQTTVSRVLHDNPKVKSETRERVRRVLREMDYLPDGIARAMVTRKTGTIGIVVEDITNPFYPEIVEALCEELARVDHRVMLWNSRESGERSAINAIQQRLVDGVVFTTAIPKSTVLHQAVRQDWPVVLVNRYVETIACDRVTTDNIRGARLIAHYFADWGHERVGLIAGLEEASTAIEREAGFLEGLQERGIEVDGALRHPGDYFYKRSYEAMTRLLALPDPPTAVFCANDLMAFGALNAAEAIGAKVPDDVWIVGFDDIKMASWEAFSLTTVRQPILEMVREAVKLLIRRIDSPARPPEHRRLGGSEVVARRSTANRSYRPRSETA